MQLPRSPRERDRLKVLHDLATAARGERLSQAQIGQILGVSVRQVRRLQRRYEEEGDTGLVHRARGRPSNRRLQEGLRQQAGAAPPTGTRATCGAAPARVARRPSQKLDLSKQRTPKPDDPSKCRYRRTFLSGRKADIPTLR